LSLSTDRAPESKAVTPAPRLAIPAEPADEHPTEAPAEEANDLLAHQDLPADTSVEALNVNGN
jgi:hypothetical protein